MARFATVLDTSHAPETRTIRPQRIGCDELRRWGIPKLELVEVKGWEVSTANALVLRHCRKRMGLSTQANTGRLLGCSAPIAPRKLQAVQT